MALSGIALEYASDFALSTGRAHLTEDLRPKNFAGFLNYAWTRAAQKKIVTHGGFGLDLMVKFNATGFTGISPGGFRTTARQENLYKWTARYFKSFSDINWLDDEVEKNKTLRAYADAGRRDLFFDELASIYESRMSDLVIKTVNGVETASFLTAPDFTSMENRTVPPTAHVCFWALLNEDKDGMYGQFSRSGTTYTSNSGVTAPFTTKQGFNIVGTLGSAAADVNKAIPTRVGYDNLALTTGVTSAAATSGEFNIISALKKGIRQSAYEQPPKMLDESGNFTTIADQDDLVYYTSDKGMGHIENSYIGSQDLWLAPSREDPAVTSPMVRGHEIKYIQAMDSIAIYDGAVHTTKVTEGQGDFKGPRFAGHRRSSLYIAHDDINWFRKRKMPPHINVPDNTVEYCDVEFTWVCEDFRAQVIVTPTTASLYGAY